MSLFKPLFGPWRTTLYSVAVAAVAATFFAVRPGGFPLNTVAIILLVVAWLAEGKWSQKLQALRENRWWMLPALLFLVYLVSVLYSSNQAEAWRQVEQKMSLILLPVIIASAQSHRKEHLGFALFAFVCSAFVATVLAYILAVFAGLAQTTDLGWVDLLTYQHLANTISFQPIYLSLYLVFAFYALLALYLNDGFRGQFFHGQKSRAFPLLAFFFVAIIMLSSRMEIMVLFATGGGLILFFLPAKRRRKYLFILSGTLLVATAIILSSSENRQRFGEMFDLEADYTDNRYGGRSIRFHKWKNTLECWANEPVLGVGAGDKQDELNKTYELNNFELALEHKFNPHNQYLDTLLAVGLAGFVLIVGWFWGAVFWGIKNRNWLLFAFGVIISLSVLTESMLERQWGVVFIVFFWAVLSKDNFKYFRKTTSEPA